MATKTIHFPERNEEIAGGQRWEVNPRATLRELADRAGFRIVRENLAGEPNPFQKERERKEFGNLPTRFLWFLELLPTCKTSEGSYLNFKDISVTTGFAKEDEHAYTNYLLINVGRVNKQVLIRKGNKEGTFVSHYLRPYTFFAGLKMSELSRYGLIKIAVLPQKKRKPTDAVSPKELWERQLKKELERSVPQERKDVRLGEKEIIRLDFLAKYPPEDGYPEKFLKDMNIESEYLSRQRIDAMSIEVDNRRLTALMSVFDLPFSDLGVPRKNDFFIFLANIYGFSNPSLLRVARKRQRKKELSEKFGKDKEKWRAYITTPEPGGLGWTPEKWLGTGTADFFNATRFGELSAYQLCQIFGINTKKNENGPRAKNRRKMLELGTYLFPDSKEIRNQYTDVSKTEKEREKLGRDPSKWREAITGAILQGGLGWTDKNWVEASLGNLLATRQTWFGVGLKGLCDIFGIPLTPSKRGGRLDRRIYLNLGMKIFPKSEAIRKALENLDR